MVPTMLGITNKGCKKGPRIPVRGPRRQPGSQTSTMELKTSHTPPAHRNSMMFIVYTTVVWCQVVPFFVSMMTGLMNNPAQQDLGGMSLLACACCTNSLMTNTLKQTETMSNFKTTPFGGTNDVSHNYVQSKVLRSCDSARSRFLSEAMFHGEAKVPLEIVELELFFDRIRDAYAEIKEDALASLRPHVTGHLGKLDKSAIEKEFEKAENEREHVRMRIHHHPLSQTGEELEPFPMMRVVLSILPYLIVLAEIFWDSVAFSEFKVHAVIATVIAVAFVGSKLVVIDRGSTLLEKARSQGIKRLVAATIFIGMTVVSAVIGHLRTMALQGDHVTEAFGTPYFVLISMFFFTCAWAAYYNTRKAREEWAVYRRKRSLHREFFELKKKESGLSKKMEALEKEMRSVLSQRIVDMDDSDRLLRKLQAHYAGTHKECKLVYTKGRKIKGEEIPTWFETMQMRDVVNPEDFSALNTNRKIEN